MKNRLFFNLQYGDVNEEIDSFNLNEIKIHVIDKLDLFNDIETCILLLNKLDLFITIDNSMAHLAGAAGIKTVLVLPSKSADYFYWKSKNNYSIWYKNIRIVKIESSISKTMDEINDIILSLNE